MEKKKRKRLDTLESKWLPSDFEKESFYDGNAFSGFFGLEELHDYDENDLKEILEKPRKKKRKLKKQSNEDETEKSDTLEIQEADENANDGKLSVKVEGKDNVETLSKKKKKQLKLKEKRKEKLKEKRRDKQKTKKAQKSEDKSSKKQAPAVESISSSVDMSNWNGLGVPEEIIKALADSSFTSPTPIQKQALLPAIFYHQDIVGAAETGSGKTLAFAIPILNHILKKKSNEMEESTNNLFALILTPTRELAMQIQSHIKSVSKYTSIKSVAVVGGLSTAKQERLLSQSPEIVVATPGRLHKLIEEGNEHLSKLDTLNYFVIDECDRMLEYGYFKELTFLIDMINQNQNRKLQKFIFSATLTLPSNHKKFVDQKKSSKDDLQSLINRVNLNNKAKVIDLTTKHVTASQLFQQKVVCTNEEKDIYLFYFLASHPGRSIIFVNSISCLRRLYSLLKLLKFNPLPLHAGKQQRQRLKSLDKFVADESGLLIATDVAARGLDIPQIRNVIHYQLPVDPKVYIHRSGRTARAENKGLSFIIEGPEDFKNYKKISHLLKLGEDIPTLQTDSGYIDGIKKRLTLAREIDKIENSSRKSNSFNSWLDKAAKSLDIDVEDSKKEKLSKKEVANLKYKHIELDRLLSEKLLPKGFSGAYPTRSGNIVTPGIIPMPS